MNPLKEAAEKHATVHGQYCGWSFAIGAEWERERILEMLRTGWPEDENGPLLYAPGDMPGPNEWADWLEEKLKEEK